MKDKRFKRKAKKINSNKLQNMKSLFKTSIKSNLHNKMQIIANISSKMKKIQLNVKKISLQYTEYYKL